VLIAVLFIIAKLWKQLRYPTINEWIKKKYAYTYCGIYYSAKKKNEIISFAGKWMKLKIIMLNKINQAEKVKCCMFSVICGT
jgi:hypothetical protein